MHSPVHYFIAQERATHLRYEAERTRFRYEDPRPSFLARLKSKRNERFARAERAESVSARGSLAALQPAERLNGHGRLTVAEPAERLNGRPVQSESCA
jgi:hypothetical protein